MTLDQVLVLELGEGAAISFCTRMLADAGARVIKVEPINGDPLRRETPVGFSRDPEHSPAFIYLNVNKESVALRQCEETSAIVRKLAARADVVVEGLPQATLAELDLDPITSISGEKRIWCSITPGGRSGSYAEYRATDLTLFASGGAMYREGVPDREPVRYAGHTATTYAGLLAASLIAAALYRLEGGGGGEYIDVAEFDAWAAHPHQAVIRTIYSYSGHEERRGVTAVNPGFGRGTFKVSDGYVTLLPRDGGHWARLLAFLGREDLEHDERYRGEFRATAAKEFNGMFAEFLSTMTRHQAVADAQHHHLPSGAVNQPAEVLDDPHLRARDAFVEVEQPGVGTLRLPGPPAQSDADFWSIRRPAPRFGEHSRDVLLEAGYGEDEIVSLLASGYLSVGNPP